MHTFIRFAGTVGWLITAYVFAIALLCACTTQPARVIQPHSHCWLGTYQDSSGNRWALECLNN
jgi:hypothetical protein